MADSNAQSASAVSPIRLRIGVVLILLWWIPFWMLSPKIASALGFTNEAKAASIITIVIMVIQTVIGLLGIYFAGKQIYELLKNTPKKRVLPKVWHILVSGKVG